MRTFLRPTRLFSLIATLEAVSWGVLLFGMYRKYGDADDPTWVSVAGPIHGGLFIAYLLATAWVGTTLRWKPMTLLVGLAAGVPPFATLLFERYVRGRGLLHPVDAAAPAS